MHGSGSWVATLFHFERDASKLEFPFYASPNRDYAGFHPAVAS